MNEKGDRSCHILYQYTFHGDISTVQRNFKLHVTNLTILTNNVSAIMT